MILCDTGYLADFIHSVAGKFKHKLIGQDCSGHGATADSGQTQKTDGHSPASPETHRMRTHTALHHTLQHRKSFKADSSPCNTAEEIL